MGCDSSPEHLPLATPSLCSLQPGHLGGPITAALGSVKPTQWHHPDKPYKCGGPNCIWELGPLRARVGANLWGLDCHALTGDHLWGKYCCLLCPKEFSSESGAKYHILKTHAEVRLDGLAPREGRGGVGMTAFVAFA